MNLRHLLILLLGLILLAAAADIAWFYPRLPERLATHFNGTGVADGYTGKVGFVVAQGCTLAGLAALFVGLAWIIPHMPVSLINLPHRDYWLAPPRRVATLETIHRFMLGLAVVTIGFLAGLLHLMLLANAHPPPRLGPGFGLLVAIQIASVLGLVVRLLWRFRKRGP